MPVNERQCQKYISIATYYKEAKAQSTAFLESGKGIEELAEEAAQYKARERAREQAAKRPPPKPEPEYNREVKYKYKEGDAERARKDSEAESESKAVFGPVGLSQHNAAVILGIPGCTEPDKDVLKAIYRFLSNKHHPDKSGNADFMAEINRAYEALKLV